MKRTPDSTGSQASTRLPSFSLEQLARRWDCPLDEVCDLVLTNELPAYLLFHETPALVPNDKPRPTVTMATLEELGERVWLDGYYRLPPKQVAHLLRNSAGGSARVEVSRDKERFAVVLIHPPDLRIRREDVERLEASQASEAPIPQLRASQRRQERCHAIAAVLWGREPNLTIEEMIDRPEIMEHGQQNTPYRRETIRAWIKTAAPNRKPGRRPMRGDQT